MKKATVRSPRVTVGGLVGDRDVAKESVTTSTQFTAQRSSGNVSYTDYSGWGTGRASEVDVYLNTSTSMNNVHIAEGEEAVVNAKLTEWSNETVQVEVGREHVQFLDGDGSFMADTEFVWHMTMDQAKQLAAELSAVIAKTQTPYNSEELAAAVFGS